MNTQNIPLLNSSALDALDKGTESGLNKVAQVASDYTRTVYRKHDRKVLYADIMKYLIVCSL